MSTPSAVRAVTAERTSSKVDPFFIALIAAFVATRVFAYLSGVRLDPTDAYQWQLIDPPLLKERLFESLLYLHSQPPLFNALHGLVVKVTSSTDGQIVAWTALHFVFGLAMLCALYGALRLLGASRLVAALLTGLFMCSPAAIAYESFLSYTYMDAALLSGALYLLIRALRLQSRTSMWLFFLVLAAMCWTRAAYHLVWLVGVAVVLAWLSRATPALFRTVLAASAASLALVAVLYVKNLALFGVAGPSSWAGMNLATMTHTNLPESARRALIDSGQASDLTQLIPFVGLDLYPPSYSQTEPTGIPVLDNVKRFDRSTNFNHAAYIDISHQFGKDALVVIRNYPGEYSQSAARNVAGFLFRSSTDYRLVASNIAKIDAWDALYSVVVYGQLGSLSRLFGSDTADEAQAVSLKNLPLTEVIFLKAKEACLFVALATIVLPLLALTQIPFRRVELDARAALAAFAVVTFAYVFLTTNLVNFGEAHRMRFEIEPLLWVLLGACVVEIRKRLEARRRGSVTG